MEATLPVLRDLTTIGDSLMWIVGPGNMVSENTSRGIQEPYVHGQYLTIRADNWLFHLEPKLVAAIKFVETYGDLQSHYVRFCDHGGETLLRAYLPRQSHESEDGAPPATNPRFDQLRNRYQHTQGVESVQREARLPNSL